MNVDRAIRDHYVVDETLVSTVTSIVDRLTPLEFDTAGAMGFDQFHIRGIAATAELAELAGVDRAMHVLDAGSGFGGPARYLAKTFGCRVRGIDLTPAFVTIAKRFAERASVDDLVSYETGDLAALPYADGAFDLVWTQHVVMNVPDRERVYGQFRRVLKPGGTVAFYDVIAAGDESEPLYPVPWAESRAESFLLTEAQTLATFERTGFVVEDWRDVTDRAIAWFAQTPATPPQGLSLAALMGPRFATMSKNFARNLHEGKLRIAMGIAKTARS